MTEIETQQNIEKALEEIRPFLVNDGGDISLIAIEETTVKVKFLGACINCNINKMTLKNGIEETIKKYAPHITDVIAIS